MLSADARLRRGQDVRLVTRRGGRAHQHGVTVHLLPAAVDGPEASSRLRARAAVVVGKKAGIAVERNRLRRQVRHSLRRCWDRVPAGAQLVVRAGPEARGLPASALDEALVAAVTRAAQPRRPRRSAQ